VIINPGGTNERFARANIKRAEIKVYGDNVHGWEVRLTGAWGVRATSRG
jgi:hypothetical protein